MLVTILSRFSGRLPYYNAITVLNINTIHSFITDIYIAPLQDHYSEVLPTTPRPKRTVLSSVTTVAKKSNMAASDWDTIERYDL